MEFLIVLFNAILASNNNSTLVRAYKNTNSFLKSAKNIVEDVLRPSKISYTKLKNSENTYKPRSASDGQIVSSSLQYKHKKDKNKKSITSLKTTNEIKLEEFKYKNTDYSEFNSLIDTCEFNGNEKLGHCDVYASKPSTSMNFDHINNNLSEEIKKETNNLVGTENVFFENIALDKYIQNQKKNRLISKTIHKTEIDTEKNELCADMNELKSEKENSIDKYKTFSKSNQLKFIEINFDEFSLFAFKSSLNLEHIFLNTDLTLEITRNELVDYKKKLHLFDHNNLQKTENGYVDMTSKIIKTFLLKINKILITCYSIHHFLISANSVYYQNISEKLNLEKFKQQHDKAFNEYMSGKILTVNLVNLKDNIYTINLILNKLFNYYTIKNNLKCDNSNLDNEEIDLNKCNFIKYKKFIETENKYVTMV